MTAGKQNHDDGTADMDTPAASVARGAEVIARHLKTLPNTPGVYRMIAGDGAVLYVGKAKDLKKRVAAYTAPDRQPTRIRRMIALTMDMEFVTTATEAEALLLESNLIRSLPFGRSMTRLTCCSGRSCCAHARTTCSPAAPGPACCTRSSAVRRPASDAFPRTTTPTWSARRGIS